MVSAAKIVASDSGRISASSRSLGRSMYTDRDAERQETDDHPEDRHYTRTATDPVPLTPPGHPIGYNAQSADP